MRFEWGPIGATGLAPHCEVVVVVDVLSFTTAVTVAADRGIEVYPLSMTDDNADQLARRVDAVLAQPRSAGSGVSLSPNSIRDAVDPPARIVLPSPNGSAIAHAIATSGSGCVAACLRNHRAVSRRLAITARRDAAVAVIAAGERWPDGSLRPAVEDLWGAGAVISGLADSGWSLSPEAQMAADAWASVAGADVADRLAETTSGRELMDMGYPQDVCTAAEVDSSAVVPVLDSGRFVAV
ncbi:2-phosphosulfolactate phosphatase [Williamsia sp. CHRR-6]|uniref:2-phosphosulfolactate phosphatase n=1 Tax=Williamsia sp. CHRR-6 TaxID=2835871 RepID=UPI0027DC4DC9|nr:2-phosphosulfolactate phosphatase [Williamsia sp. CHRR-6]